MLPRVPGRGQFRAVGKTMLVLRQHAGKSKQRNSRRHYTSDTGMTDIILVQYVHQECLQLWINEKGSKLCEICKQPYQVGEGSSASSPVSSACAVQLTDVLLQGSYADPPVRSPSHVPNSALLAHLRRHGVVLRAVPVSDATSLQQQDEAQVPTS